MTTESGSKGSRKTNLVYLQLLAQGEALNPRHAEMPSSEEGLALVRAFYGIRHRADRAKVIELAQKLLKIAN
ncbi:MAG: hypothetical protein H6923_08000 [Alphaproteobacteria bacterium]|nr:hypothetical protein [Alphaproteobacteria bacterium]